MHCENKAGRQGLYEMAATGERIVYKEIQLCNTPPPFGERVAKHAPARRYLFLLFAAVLIFADSYVYLCVSGRGGGYITH